MTIRRPRPAFTLVGEPDAQAKVSTPPAAGPRGRRPAFTLIELIIVMTLMVIIASLGFLFLPNLDRHKGVPNATTQLEGWIRLGKAQALRDGSPRGVRFLLADPNDARYDPNNPLSRVTAVQYIEQPEPIAPRGQVGGNRIALVITTQNPNPTGPPPYPNPTPATAMLALIDANNNPVSGWNWDDPNNPQIFPGDFLELSSGQTVVAQIIQGPSVGLGYPRAMLTLDRGINGTEPAPYGNPLVLTDGFRVIRAPRPLQGEPLLQLHKDVYIDLTNCYPCPVNLGAQVPPPTPSPYGNYITAYQPWSPSKDPVTGLNYIDILFNASGQVANAGTGQIIVCLQHVDRPTDKLLVVIYTRTGKVTAVDYNDAGLDPYVFARDGKSSGL